MSSSTASPIMRAIKQFEATEANLAKLEILWGELQHLPGSVSFGEAPEYEDRSREVAAIVEALPLIDGWKPSVSAPDWDSVMGARFDFMELGDPAAEAQFEGLNLEDGKDLREYRHRLNQKRRALIRDEMTSIIKRFDADLAELRLASATLERHAAVSSPIVDELVGAMDQIEVLLGSSVRHPPRWSDLRRHLHFRMRGDFDDIEKHDWPAVREGLQEGLYGVNEAIPVEVADLADLVAAKPEGPVISALSWSNLDDEGFERLMFSIISGVPSYENPEWLMRTNAPDRGRDISVTRVMSDPLAGTHRDRVIIQCKHWLSKSVSLPDVIHAAAQTELWGDPPVSVLIIATSGRFTTDAVQWIEKHNHQRRVPTILMWPESHLESLLASRPALIAQFALR